MKPAKSSANRCCRSATMRRSPPRLPGGCMTDRPLWAVEAMVAAMRAARNGPLPPSVPGISIDTRTIAPGEAFFAIKGDNRDGHDFVAAALAAGAGLAVV